MLEKAEKNRIMGKIIGIDPAFRKNGMAVAIIDLSSKKVTAQILNGVIDFYKLINSFDRDEIEFIVVEDASKQNVTFFNRNKSDGNRKNKETMSLNVAARISRNVGMVQAVSAQIVEISKEFAGEEKVIAVSPKEKGVKIYDRRIFSAYLKSIGLEYVGERDTQDIRDAVKIATIAMTSKFRNMLKDR